MENLHTPGPWLAVPNQEDEGLTTCIQLLDGKVIAIAELHYFSQAQEAQANAKLIAAAPELLEVCKKALIHFEHLGLVGTRGVMEDIKQIINKATGAN